jgi:Zn finger protein HypA/HybF involved in hydrogenase expression
MVKCSKCKTEYSAFFLEKCPKCKSSLSNRMIDVIDYFGEWLGM